MRGTLFFLDPLCRTLHPFSCGSLTEKTGLHKDWHIEKTKLKILLQNITIIGRILFLNVPSSRMGRGMTNGISCRGSMYLWPALIIFI